MAAAACKHWWGAGRGPGYLWFAELCPRAMGIKRGEQMQEPVRSSNGELVTDWLGQRAQSGLLSLGACFPSSRQGLIIMEGITRWQACRRASGVEMSSQHIKEKIWGSRGRPVLNPQVLTGTLRRYQHPQGGPHFGLPATQGHLSLPKVPACLWGLLPSCRSLSLRDCALQTTAQQKKKILCLVQSKLLLWNPARD